MNARILAILALVFLVGLGGLLYVERSLAQPPAQPGPVAQMGPGGQMMGPQQMPMGQMMGQMQQQMTQMATNLQAMRAQLDRVNPALLTPSERAMYEYFRLLQVHMETMQGWVGNAQGVMRRMPGVGTGR
jgi:hypothetical protein